MFRATRPPPHFASHSHLSRAVLDLSFHVCNTTRLLHHAAIRCKIGVRSPTSTLRAATRSRQLGITLNAFVSMVTVPLQ